MKLLLASVGAAAILISAGCSASSKTENQITDSQLEQMVKTRLQADGSVSRLNLGVDANAEHKAVELTGTAYTERQRTRAVELAQNIVPGVVVNDKIEVKPYEVPRDLFDDEMMQDAKADATKAGDKMGEKIDDAWIHTKIVSKLIADSDTPERKINVDVMDAVVTLRGKVPSAEARSEAERISANVEGVSRVVNKLQVSKG